jgi:hypothetical protein
MGPPRGPISLPSSMFAESPDIPGTSDEVEGDASEGTVLARWRAGLSAEWCRSRVPTRHNIEKYAFRTLLAADVGQKNRWSHHVVCLLCNVILSLSLYN